MKLSININERVWVRLNEDGINHANEYLKNSEYYKKLFGEYNTIERFSKSTLTTHYGDKEIYYGFQLWTFMAIFGGECLKNDHINQVNYWIGDIEIGDI